MRVGAWLPARSRPVRSDTDHRLLTSHDTDRPPACKRNGNRTALKGGELHGELDLERQNTEASNSFDADAEQEYSEPDTRQWQSAAEQDFRKEQRRLAAVSLSTPLVAGEDALLSKLPFEVPGTLLTGLQSTQMPRDCRTRGILRCARQEEGV